MGNHEYCPTCGESDFHYGYACNPEKVAAVAAKEKADNDRADAAFALAQEKLTAAGIPFTARVDSHGIRHLLLDYWQVAKS